MIYLQTHIRKNFFERFSASTSYIMITQKGEKPF